MFSRRIAGRIFDGTQKAILRAVHGRFYKEMLQLIFPILKDFIEVRDRIFARNPGGIPGYRNFQKKVL